MVALYLLLQMFSVQIFYGVEHVQLDVLKLDEWVDLCNRCDVDILLDRVRVRVLEMEHARLGLQV